MKTLFDDAVYYVSEGGTIWKMENGRLLHRWGAEWMRRSADSSQDEQLLKEWLRTKAVKEILHEDAV
jgi:hypothetical protein